MIMNRINDFAKENGYDKIEYLKDWNGYKCYEPIMNSEEVSFVGLPLVILVKNDTIRMSTPSEALKI